MTARHRALAFAGPGLLVLLVAVAQTRAPAQSTGGPEAAHGASPPDQVWDFQPVRAHILRVMEERHLPSVSVAVAVEGRVAWEEAFGWADVEARSRQHRIRPILSPPSPNP